MHNAEKERKNKIPEPFLFDGGVAVETSRLRRGPNDNAQLGGYVLSLPCTPSPSPHLRYNQRLI
jgi:hypothetical protein